MRTTTFSRTSAVVVLLATLAAAVLANALAAVPAHAGEYGFYYRSSSGGSCGGGYFVPPPPVYHRRPAYRPAPQWGGGCGQQPYYQPAPQQWGPPPGYGYGYQPTPPPDSYRSTTTCRNGSCWQDTSSTWRTPNGGRVRVNQSGPVAPPWETQTYGW